MKSTLKTVLEAVAGALGGFVAWVIVEPFEFLTSDERRVVSSGADWWALAIFGAIMGCAISTAIGAVEGISFGSRQRLRRAVMIGGVVGLAGGVVGLYLGQIVYARLQPRSGGGGFGLTLFTFLQGVAARAIGWGFVGTAIGIAQGVPSFSPRKMKHGAIGGAIGGFLGGVLFDFIGEILNVGGAPSRMVGMTLTGGAIGFFLGLVEDLMKQAWVVVLRGRNEGRQYILDKPVNVLGRDELVEVGVFGDPTVAARHAVIKVESGVYVIEDLGTSTSGTVVNGQRVERQILHDGDTIQIGASRIVFHEKARAHTAGQRRDVARVSSVKPPQLADDVCAFCGERKDPRTGACACMPATAQGAARDSAVPGSLGESGGVGAVYSSSPQPLGSARLVCVAGGRAGEVVPLSKEVFTIGREPGRDLVLAGDPTVSRRHASLCREGGQYVLVDDGSSNGTFVNGVRVTTHSLRHGDRIRIGTSEFQFEAGGAL